MSIVRGNDRGAASREESVQVPDEIRKCVVFVGYERDGREHYGGTAFFVGVEIDARGYAAVYLVTARHVVKEASSRSATGRILIRANTKDGSGVTVTTAEQWVTHPDPAVDVAVINAGPRADLDFRMLGPQMFVTADVIAREGIGLGDDVVVAGLFTSHKGNKRNIPIVRVGNIAAMPEEPVAALGGAEAYFVEVRSIGGLSGSPVFVNLGLIRRFDGQVKTAMDPKGPLAGFLLLGLIHGHWSVPAPSADSADEDIVHDERINQGIAIVVPATKILEVLNREELVKSREDERVRLTQSPAAG
jgi:hypothetical protein